MPLTRYLSVWAAVNQLCGSVALIFLIVLLRGDAGAEHQCARLPSIPVECNHLLLGHDARNGSNATAFANFWMTKISEDGGSLYNISLTDGILYQTGLVDHGRYGNALLPYWHARALAFYAGLAYEMLPVKASRAAPDFFKSATFLKFLPAKVPRSTCCNLKMLQQMCGMCHTFCLLYPSWPSAAWLPIRNAIRHELQAAFKTWAIATNFTLPTFDLSDVVIQDRCDNMTLLRHPAYGPPGFSFYAPIAREQPRNIYIITDPNLSSRSHRPFFPCRAMHQVLCNHLALLAPNSSIHSVGHHDVDLDFARLLLAPTIYKGYSTFSLWAAVANHGTVHSTPFVYNTTPDLGPNWHWSHAPLLDQATSRKLPAPALNLVAQPDQLDRVITWLIHN